MGFDFRFFINSFLLGVGLSMDAFSVSVANGLNERDMKKGKVFLIAGTFAFFQALMPFIGWLIVHTAVGYFDFLDKAVPFVALFLLLFIGGKMIFDGVKKKKGEKAAVSLGFVSLIVKGIATSIDALSVGFTVADLELINTLVCVLIIASVTFALCLIGVFFGKKLGEKFSDYATVVGGIILIAIGVEIFITGII